MIKNELDKPENNLEDTEILFSFFGSLSQDIIENLTEILRKKMLNKNVDQKIIISMISIFIEQTQNIMNYNLSKEDSKYYNIILNSSKVTVSHEEKGYNICSANIVEHSDLVNLIERLNKLRHLKSDDLKKLYKQQINKEVSNNARGAGLGLIDMSRKASLPIDYSVSKYNDDLSYFSLSSIV